MLFGILPSWFDFSLFIFHHKIDATAALEIMRVSPRHMVLYYS